VHTRPTTPTRRQSRVADPHVTTPPVLKGTLWKLNQNGDAGNKMHWIRRDMWFTFDGKLCYYSLKETRRCVLVDGSTRRGLQISRVGDAAKEHAFKLRTGSPTENDVVLACDSSEQYGLWTTKILDVAKSARVPTLQLGTSMALEFDAIRLAVRNRRQRVPGESRLFEPAFKAKLWKLDGDGDRTKRMDWRERDMWISKNGSLVYWSPKEGRELVYYSAEDLSKCIVKRLANGTTAHPWAFQIQLPASKDVEFAPGEFSAESFDLREQWLRAITRCSR